MHVALFTCKPHKVVQGVPRRISLPKASACRSYVLTDSNETETPCAATAGVAASRSMGCATSAARLAVAMHTCNCLLGTLQIQEALHLSKAKGMRQMLMLRSQNDGIVSAACRWRSYGTCGSCLWLDCRCRCLLQQHLEGCVPPACFFEVESCKERSSQQQNLGGCNAVCDGLPIFEPFACACFAPVLGRFSSRADSRRAPTAI